MKKLKSQQITEFMLAAPLLIIFFAVLTEFAFALNANLVFTNAIKSSVIAYISTISSDTNKTEMENAIKDYVKSDMQKNKIPNLSSLNVSLINVGDNPAVIGNYTYKPGFTFAFLPALKNINMSAITLFPITAIDFTGYENAISTEELNSIQPQIVQEGGDVVVEP